MFAASNHNFTFSNMLIIYFVLSHTDLYLDKYQKVSYK